jgi:hypothetical protein
MQAVSRYIRSTSGGDDHDAAPFDAPKWRRASRASGEKCSIRPTENTMSAGGGALPSTVGPMRRRAEARHLAGLLFGQRALLAEIDDLSG